VRWATRRSPVFARRGGVRWGSGWPGSGIGEGGGVDAARLREARGAYLFQAVPGRTMRGETQPGERERTALT
jgi:hypothetical protein